MLQLAAREKTEAQVHGNGWMTLVFGQLKKRGICGRVSKHHHHEPDPDPSNPVAGR